MQPNQNNQNPTPTTDNGLELLKKVIESNEDNIERMVELSGSVEDLGNIVGELECTVRTVNYNIGLFETMKDEFLEQFKQIIGQIPQKHYMDFSENSISTLDKFHQRLTEFENETRIFIKHKIATYYMLGFIALIIILCFYFSRQWYNTSIKTKMEIRTELLQEIKNDKKEIYNKNEVEQLKYNTELIKKWMKKNPKDAEKFLKFKDGYESR